MTLDLLGIGITVVGFLVGAVGALYGSSLKSANNAYKEDASALRGLLDTKEAIITEQGKQIAVMDGGIKILRDTVSAAPDIAKLSTEIAKQHKEVLQSLSNVANSNSAVANSLNELMKILDTPKVSRSRRSK